MHYKGRSIWTTVSRAGEYVEDLDRKEYWNNGFQQLLPRREPFVLLPGDRLNTHCVFDTRRAGGPVAFGPTTKDEMCMDFLFYYPRQMRRLGDAEDADEVAYCGPLPGPSRKRGAALYVCGTPDRQEERRKGLPSPFLLPGNAQLSEKWDPEGSPGATPTYRFDDEGRAVATAAPAAPAAASAIGGPTAGAAAAEAAAAAGAGGAAAPPPGALLLLAAALAPLLV